MSEKIIVQVIVHTPLWQSFDYLLSVADFSNVKVGQRVLVPFGSRQCTGVILNIVSQTQFALEKLKEVIRILDTKPLFTKELIEFYQWASDYYHYPLGEVIFSTMPKLLRSKKSIEIKIKEKLAAHETVEATQKEYSLSQEQQKAIKEISSKEGYQTFLLAGVTGSGKTEVYLHCIENILQKKRQALILVPEIALTPQTVMRFRERFVHAHIVILHSELPDSKRKQAYAQAAFGEADIVIGTRSAIFIPLLRPGIIILDEEHDASFKQQSGFRYSARDLAVVRGRMHNIAVVLGSATPSIESWYNIKLKRYALLSLPQRVGSAQLPKVTIIDLRQQTLLGGMCETLLNIIAQHLQAKNQVMLFINRRGFAPVLLCHHCGWMVPCQHCDSRMTLHDYPKRLHCHHCGASQIPPRICLVCKQSELMPIGSGTEQIEKILANYFPNNSILRIDRDNVRNKKQLDEALTQAHSGDADILIGTQMLAKGHHFERLTLVAVVDADGGLFSGDFRATERMLQLILQVAGRAGREIKKGEVVIQTHCPEHPLLSSCITHDYFSYAEKILTERQAVGLPPFSYLAMIRAESKQQKFTHEFLEQLKNELTAQKTAVQILGPVNATMERKADRYRAQLLLQAKSRTTLQRLLHPILRNKLKNKWSKKVRWSLDIDPIEM